MKRHTLQTIVSILILAIILLPAFVFGEDTPSLAGAGEASLPADASYGGFSVTGLTFGMGIFIYSDGTAAGPFQTTLLGAILHGQPQDIEVEGEAAAGTINANGSRTFSGTATVDMGGDGALRLENVPFTVTVTSTSVLLSLSGTNLPANVTKGGITLQ